MEYLQLLLSGAVTFLSGFASNHPALAAVFMGIGMARSIFKPLSSFVHSIVEVTPSTKDNEMLTKAEGSAVYKWLLYALDYIASIKIVPKA
jgi:hypothetical protein